MSSHLPLRVATLADATALHLLVEGAYRGTSAQRGWTHEAHLLDGQRTDVEALTESIEDPSQIVLLAHQDDVLIGSVTISDKGEGLAYLGLLTVDPQSQANGLGRRLIVAAEAIARQDFAAEVMEMTVIKQRAELIAYYERRGYAQTGEERPFPYNLPRFGLPTRTDLVFVVLSRRLDSDAL
jgi:ribosomal protein S18 acetylase RimI-like enzyme